MINWKKGLTPEQQEQLDISLIAESYIVAQEHTFESPDDITTVIGALLPRNTLFNKRITW